ncbi:MAG: nuclear transport factor 2 family protein [Pseudomonadota bacterium]
MRPMPLLQTLTFTFLVAACAGATQAQEAVSEEACLAMERDRYAAMIAADVADLDAMLDDALVFIHASGRTDTKTTFLDRLGSGNLNYKSIELEEPRTQAFEGACIVTGRSNLAIEVGGNARELSLLFTAVWVRTTGGWRVAAYQSTSAR